MADGGQLKLGRARGHAIEARKITRTWLDSDAFTIGSATDHRTGRTEARVQLQASPPDQLALAVGDAIHNLRAALDHAVFDAALRHAGGSLTEEEERALSFPITRHASASNRCRTRASSGRARTSAPRAFNIGEPIPLSVIT